MKERISRNTLEELRVRTDIVDVVSEHVPLKRAGSSLKGLCPFHGEKTPSFFVSREKGVFYCFGCGKGGDSITFLMKLKNMEYRDVVEELCEKYGLEITYDGASRDLSPYKAMYEVTSFAAEFFWGKLMKEDNPALPYLQKRGLTNEILHELQIGYGGGDPEGLARAIVRCGLQEEVGIGCGLLYRGKRGDLRDRFSRRAIFPVRNRKGKVAGFAGRSLDERGPKYINSSESIIYKKKNLLYGLDRAGKFIREEKAALVVEGYMDWIALWQGGIKNVVATCGTAITREHFRLLSRTTDKVILLFDGDMAGKKAALRSVEGAYQVGVSPYVLFPPSRMDPDDWMRKEGADEVKRALGGARLVIDYVIDGAAKKFDLERSSHTLEYVNLLSKYMGHVKDPVEREIYVKKVAKKIDLSPDEVRKKFFERGMVTKTRPVRNIPPRERKKKPEFVFLGYLLKHPTALSSARVVEAVYSLKEPELKEIGELLVRKKTESPGNNISSTYIGEEEKNIRSSEAILLYEQAFSEDREENLEKILGYLRRTRLEEELFTIMGEIRKEEDSQKRSLLLRRQEELKKEMENIGKNI